METFNSPDEAFDYTISIAYKLNLKEGIEIEISPYNLKGNHGKNMVSKFGNLPNSATPKKWCRIVFRPKNHKQSLTLIYYQRMLRSLGIGFDTGGGSGERDWETDWSFSYDQSHANEEDYKASLDSIGE